MMFEGQKRERIRLGNRTVVVIKPKEHVSYEEGCKRIETILKGRNEN